jgi:hypothetical protein
MRNRLAEIRFQRPCSRFHGDIRSRIRQRPPVGTDVGNDEMIVVVGDIGVGAGFPGMLPDDEGVILRVHGDEDSPDRFVALRIRHSVPGRDRNVMAGNSCPRGIAHSFHVTHDVVGICQRHTADGDNAGGLARLLVQMSD